MNSQQYRVHGSYQAKYPDGHYTGKIGIGATVQAQDQQDAEKKVASQTQELYGYVNFKWISVNVDQVIA